MMLKRTWTFSIDPETDEPVILWWRTHENYSKLVVEALREKMMRDKGKSTQQELLEKIWDKLKNMDVISTDQVAEKEDLAHLGRALSAFDMFE